MLVSKIFQSRRIIELHESVRVKFDFSISEILNFCQTFYMRKLTTILCLTIAVLLGSAGFQVFAQTLEELRAKLQSMNACRQSLGDPNCRLEILDPHTRQTLQQIDLLKRSRNNLRGPATSNLSGTHEFFTDSISEANSEVIRLMGGTLWTHHQSYYGLILEDVIGVVTGKKTATLYVDGNTFSAELVRGSVVTSSGILTSVIDEKGDGRLLKLDNGMLLTFSSYDAYDTGWWLPPYQVLIDLTSMYMWNLEKGKKVWIESIE